MNSLRHARGLAGGARALRRPRRPTCRPTSSRTRSPKLLADGLAPVDWPADPALEWARPGTATSTRRCRPRGCSTRCSSAATARRSSRTPTTSARCSTRASSPGSRARGCPFAMEVAERTRGRPQGRPPRAPARRRAGSCCARPRRRPTRTSTRSRTSRATASSTRTTSGSTCEALRCAARRRDGVLGLPMIVNRKTVDPRDPSSPAVDPARDGDGRGDRRLRRARGRCASRARASCR